MIDMHAEPCNCAPGECRECCDPQENCVNFLARNHEVLVKLCETCKSYTWHRDGECLRAVLHEINKPSGAVAELSDRDSSRAAN